MNYLTLAISEVKRDIFLLRFLNVKVMIGYPIVLGFCEGWNIIVGMCVRGRGHIYRQEERGE
jgi:hypothetical protein